jgi:hypothetical protein
VDKLSIEFRLNWKFPSVHWTGMSLCGWRGPYSRKYTSTPGNVNNLTRNWNTIWTLYRWRENYMYMEMTATPSDKLPKVTIGQHISENARNST